MIPSTAAIPKLSMKLSHKPDYDIRAKLADALFELDTSEPDQLSSLEEFFHYYEEELRLLQVGTLSRNQLAARMAIDEHEQVVVIVQILKENYNKPKHELRDRVSAALSNPTTDSVDWAIDFCLRVWLMLNVQKSGHQSLRPFDTSLGWPEDMSLESWVSSIFQPCFKEFSRKDARFDVGFTIASMIDICGLRLHWTSNLHDHLLLNRRKRILSVFAYQHVVEFGERSRSPVPRSILDEVAKSLDLLFPVWDSRTDQILSRANRQPWWLSMNLADGTVSSDHRRMVNLNDFRHWQDRLIELNEEVFQAPPITWKQLWRDRRNPQLFYTFWLAFAIFILSVGQFVTSVVQTWASVQALRRS